MLKVMRFICAGTLFVVFHILGFLLCLARPRNPKNTFWIARSYGALAPVMGIRIKRTISPKVDVTKPAIYIANHQSNWDTIVLTNTVMPNTVAVGKKSLVWLPFFGQIFWLSGNILIDRGNRQKARNVVDTMVANIKEKQFSVWLFPEGTRSRGRGLLPFKTGAFYAAIKAGVPIIPVVCEPYRDRLDFNRWESMDVKIDVLDPIDTSAYSIDDLRRLIERCTQIYQEKLDAYAADAASE